MGNKKGIQNMSINVFCTTYNFTTYNILEQLIYIFPLHKYLCNLRNFGYNGCIYTFNSHYGNISQILNNHIDTSVNETMKGNWQTFEKVRKTVFLVFCTLIERSDAKSNAISNSIQTSFQLFKTRSTKTFKNNSY